MERLKASICLCMIVKNEANVIARCLQSVRPFIDYWVIVDTGSTDGTQDIVRQFLQDVPGVLYQREWRDFAYNRSEALELARPHADYSLIIDADDYFQLADDFSMPVLSLDSYTMNITDGPLVYPRTQLVSNRLKWIYRGVLHEFVTSEEPLLTPPGHLPIAMYRGHDGARRRDSSTYNRDVNVLSKALKTERDPYLRSRYTFYLAQSYRDAQNFSKAIDFYLQRANMGGWEEEVFYSFYQVAKLKEAAGAPINEILSTYEAATKALPTRNEARCASSRLCRIAKQFDKGYRIAKEGLNVPYPPGSLFGEPWVYEFGLFDEFAVNAHWVGKYDECVVACLRALKANLDRDNFNRILSNATAAMDLFQNEQSCLKQVLAEQVLANAAIKNELANRPASIR